MIDHTLFKKTWHSLDNKEICNLFKVNIDSGLDFEEVELRRNRDGPNKISNIKQVSNLERFASQFKQPMIYILVIAATITAFLQEWIDSSVIFAVVIVNAVVGFVQESKASKAIEALSKIMVTEATVIRNKGKKSTIKSEEVVVGDIVILKSGDKVPADIRLVKTRELKIDESTLTGESVPVDKNSEVLKQDTVLSDRKNMAFAGTFVTYGRAIGVVVDIGNNTETGRISESIRSAEELTTPLTQKLSALTKLLLYIIGGSAALTFVVGIIQKHPFIDMFMISISLLVSAIPEGLPGALTIILSIGVNRMAKKNVIIRKLPVVETLGSTTVICSDKTGTLTENEMTVIEVVAGENIYGVSGVGYLPKGEINYTGTFTFSDSSTSHDNTDDFIITTIGVRNDKIFEGLSYDNTLLECLLAGLLCNEAQLLKDEADGQWKVKGDPTDGSLIVLSKKAGLDESKIRNKLPRIDAIPFESHLQYMATLHNNDNISFHINVDDDSKQTIYVKGAIEKILHKCNTILIDVNKDTPGINASIKIKLTPQISNKIMQQAEERAKMGLRIIAFAKKDIKYEEKIQLLTTDILEKKDLIFLGFVCNDRPTKTRINWINNCMSFCWNRCKDDYRR